jgi:hypothetical protein
MALHRAGLNVTICSKNCAKRQLTPASRSQKFGVASGMNHIPARAREGWWSEKTQCAGLRHCLKPIGATAKLQIGPWRRRLV